MGCGELIMAAISRSRITAWPMDAWAKRMVSNHEPDPAARDMPLWWASPLLWDNIPTGWQHVGYVEVGAADSRDYDRGALLRHDDQKHLAMWTGKVLRNINQRKAEAAVAALAR